MLDGDEDDINPYMGKPALKLKPLNLLEGTFNELEN